MAHLGTQISALADGRLGPEAAERALGHVAGCAECAAELAATRAARVVLHSAGDVPPGEDLAVRLLALPNGSHAALADDRPGARRSPFGRHRRPIVRGGEVPLPGAEDPVPAGCLRGEVVRRGLPIRALAATTLGIVAVWLFALGEEEVVTPEGHPASALALLATVETGPAEVVLAASGSPGASASGPSAVADGAGLALPQGYRVAAVHREPGAVELDLAGPDGTVIVTRTDGRLAEHAVDGAPVATIGGARVWVLSTAPWHVVWQSGETVVEVVAGRGSPAVEAVLAAHPVERFDDGVPARIARGWRALVGAWGP